MEQKINCRADFKQKQATDKTHKLGCFSYSNQREEKIKDYHFSGIDPAGYYGIAHFISSSSIQTKICETPLAFSVPQGSVFHQPKPVPYTHIFEHNEDLHRRICVLGKRTMAAAFGTNNQSLPVRGNWYFWYTSKPCGSLW